MSQHRVLIVGVGSIGERHVRCFLRTGRAEVGIVEPCRAVARAVAGRYDIPAVYDNLDAALRQEAWSTAVICTPASTHVDLALQSLDAALPTLIEKPLAVATVEAAPLLHRSGMGPCIGVAYVYRAHPAVVAMREALGSGRFGQPLQVVTVQGQHFPTYRPAYASTYYRRHETGGGAIQDALTHLFNAAEWLVGPITRIAVDARHLVLPDVAVEDTVHALAHHGRVMASYALNQHQAANETLLTVVCEGGVLRFEGHRTRWRWQTDPRGEWTDCPVEVTLRDTWFELQANAWLDAVEGRAAPLCTLDEAYQTLAVNETALNSARCGGQWLDVPRASVPAKERSVDVGA